MKITASRRDDLLKEKAEYDAKMAERQKQFDEEDLLYRKARKDARELVEGRVKRLIGDSPLDIEIQADEEFDWHSGKSTWSVRVRVDEYHHTSALSWDWSAKINGEGEVVYDSGSWSGLKACTFEQLDELKESVRIIETLLNADWIKILNAPIPSRSNYIDDANERAMYTEGRNFDKELFEADLEALVGSDKLIKTEGFETAYWRAKGYMYIQILSESDQFYTIKVLPDSYVKYPEYRQGKTLKEYLSQFGSERKKKDVVKKAIIKPLEIHEVSEFK